MCHDCHKDCMECCYRRYYLAEEQLKMIRHTEYLAKTRQKKVVSTLKRHCVDQTLRERSDMEGDEQA